MYLRPSPLTLTSHATVAPAHTRASYELSAKKGKSLAHELSVATIASIFLGLGAFFCMLWAGVWV